LKIIIGLTLIVLLALLGSRRTFTKIKLPLATRHIYLTGTEFILVGLCLGGLMLGLLDFKALRGLDPLLHLAFGWIGLLFGIQLQIGRVGHFGRQYLLFALLQAVVTFFFCCLPFLLLLPVLGIQDDFVLLGALTLGAIAVPTAQSSLAMIQRELGLGRNKLMEMLSYVAGIDAMVALVIFGFLFCFAHCQKLGNIIALVNLQYVGISIGLGLGTGLLLHFLTRIRCSQEELVLFVIGSVAFCAGAAASLGVSPLFVTFLSGMMIANLRGQKARISRALNTLEKPLYIIVLIMGGAMLGPVADWPLVLLLAAIYIVLRVGGKVAGGLLSSGVLRSPERIPRPVGLALTSQGGMAAAMVVSFHRAFDDELSNTILMMILVAIVINELIGPFLARFLVRGAR